MDLTLSSALQSSLGRWSVIWTKSMTDKCWSVWGKSSFLLGHTTNQRQLLAALYCYMLALTSSTPLRNPTCFALFEYQRSIYAYFLYWVRFLARSAYRSRPILCFSLYLKIYEKRCKTQKLAFGGLQMLNNFVLGAHRVRASLHSIYIWQCCARLVSRLRSADHDLGRYRQSLSFPYIWKYMKTLKKHEKMPLMDLKIYIFYFLDPFGSGLHRYRNLPMLPLYFLIFHYITKMFPKPLKTALVRTWKFIRNHS